MKTIFNIANPLKPAEYDRRTDAPFNGKKVNNFFKPGLKVVILLLFSVTIYRADAGTPGKPVAAACTLRTGGSIVVIDDVTLEVTTNDGSTIQTVIVHDGTNEVYSSKGCYETLCDYDLTGVPPGNYEVYVQTSSGAFSGPISIK